MGRPIRLSAETRSHRLLGGGAFTQAQKLRCAVAGLLEKIPEDLRNSPEAKLLSAAADRKVFNVIHLIYRARGYEGHSKDYEFSRMSMEEHWLAGYHDARRTLRHREVFERPKNTDGMLTFDLVQDGRE